MHNHIFNDFQFDALRGALYHRDRAAFFRSLDKLMTVGVIAMGMSTVVKAVGMFGWNEIGLGLAVVLLATTQSVLDFAGRAAYHSLMQHRCYDLLAEISSSRRPRPQEWTARLLKLCSDGPNTMRAANILAYNKALDTLAANDTECARHRKRLRWWHILFRHIIPFHSAEFPIGSPLSRPVSSPSPQNAKPYLVKGTEPANDAGKQTSQRKNEQRMDKDSA